MKFSLLFAEDDTDFAQTVIDYLTDHGFSVIHADNGVDAVKKYRQFNPDIVLLDVMMPQMTGYDVINKIRLKDKTTPVLYLTGLSSSEHAVKGLRLGANDYIRKGVALEEVKERLAVSLRDRNKQDNLTGIRLTENTMLDTATKEIITADGRFDLNYKEFNLIHYLAANQNTRINRDFFYRFIWNDNINADKYLNKSVSKLRKILASDNDISIVSFRSNGIMMIIKKY